MIFPLEHRLHVIQRKRLYHTFPNRTLTDQEWSDLKGLYDDCRFQRGEEISEGLYFIQYHRGCQNGMVALSGEQLTVHEAKLAIRNVKNRDRNLQRSRDDYLKNREAVIKRTSEYNKRHSNARKVRYKKWVAANPEKVKQYNNTEGKKRVSVPRKRTMRLLRTRLRAALRGAINCGRDSEYESVEFLLWLAQKQNIDPRNGYDIDHIIPISTWDLTIESNQVAVNAPENVCWLPKIDNLLKSNSLPSEEKLKAHRELVALWRSGSSAEEIAS